MSGDGKQARDAVQEVPPGYKRTEVGVIPEEWDVARLADRCVTYSGGTPSTSRPDFYGGNIPWITSGDLNARRIRTVSGCIAQKGLDSSAARMVSRGDLVLALYGATAGIVAITEIDAAINQAVLAIRSNQCEHDYLFQYLTLRKREIVETYTQGGQPNLSGAIIRSLAIALPLLPEQRAIAEALSDVDGLLGALEALIAKKRAIKQAAMQQLLTGKTRLPGFSGEWETKRLGEIGHFLKGSGVKRDDARSGTLACVRYGEIYTTHDDCIRTFQSWISPEIAATATRLEYGDLLFAGSGETKEEIGKCVAFVTETEAYAGGDIVILRPRDVDPLFFGYALNLPAVARQKASLGQGDAVVHISATALAQVYLAVPPIQEQSAIATVLSDMDAAIAALEARRDKTRAIKQGMMQQLLTGRVRLVKPEAAA